MQTPKLERVKFKKIKTIKGGGLEVEFDIEIVSGQETYHVGNVVKSSKHPHPDLMEIFKEFKTHVKQVYQFDKIKEFDDLNLSINGISKSGKDQNKGIIIMANYNPDMKYSMAINTHRIRYTDTYYGFEESLEEIIERLEKEVYEFLFNGKQAQLEMFTEEETSDDV